MTFTINNNTWELEFSFNADFIYEDIMQGKSFGARNLTEWFMFFYSYYLDITKDYNFGFDDFVLECSKEHPRYIYEFINWYTTFYETNLKIIPKNKEEKTEKKAKTRKQTQG